MVEETYPADDNHSPLPVGAALWCIEVFITAIEGHVTGRRAANIQDGTLHTITLEGCRRPSPSGAPRPPHRSMRSRPSPASFAIITALPTEGGACHHWSAWSRESGSGGPRHSRCSTWAVTGCWVRRVSVCSSACPGQPLARLQSIATIQLGFTAAGRGRAVVDRLQAALTSRGCCRSLNQLRVAMRFFVIDSTVLPILQSLASLHNACCPPDAQVAFENRHVAISGSRYSSPSCFLKLAFRAGARAASAGKYTFSQQRHRGRQQLQHRHTGRCSADQANCREEAEECIHRPRGCMYVFRLYAVAHKNTYAA